jgi:signal transduction histidine kinase/CheY-like chemotaxis protein
MRSILFILLFWVLILSFANQPEILQAKEPPTATNGILDLSDWDFEKEGPVSLNGEWLFYWKEFIKPLQEPGHGSYTEAELVTLPGAWNESPSKSDKLGVMGYASYRLNVFLKNSDTRLALQLPEIRTAFTAFVNGTRITSAGVIGRNEKTSKPNYFPHIASFMPVDESLEIIIHVSNYHFYKGGLFTSIRLGSEKEMLKSWDRNQAIDFFVFGGLIVMGFYHLGLFLMRRSERSPFYFGLICLLISVRVLVQGSYFLVHLLPTLSWDWVVKLDYLSFYLTAPLFLVYARSLFPEAFQKKVVTSAIVLGAGFSMMVLFTNPIYFSHTTTVFQVATLIGSIYLFYALFRSALYKRKGALIFLIGFFLLFITVANDILYENDILKIGILVPFGMFAFIFAQAFLISARFSKSFQSVENLSVEIQVKSSELNSINTELASLNETLERKVEDRTRDLNETVHQLKLAIQRTEQLAEEALSANAAKSSFLANMSHEIRTPMNGIIGMTNLLLETEMNVEQVDFANTVKSSADSLLIIINDILDISKIEAGKLKFETIDFDLRAALENVSELLSLKAREKNLEFTCRVHFDVPKKLQGDPGRLKQILINLSGNAIKFSEKGEILIKVGMEKETGNVVTLRFEVKDSGIGISQQEQKALFKSFSQVDPSVTRKYGGTGLGLAISKQLAEMMNGEIGVHSTSGEGSTFWFTADFEKQSGNQQGEPVLPKDIEGRHILVVHATDGTHHNLGDDLTSWGCRHETAASGKKALDLMKKAYSENDQFEIAILDMKLPNMTGHKLGSKIKSDPELKDTELVLLASTGTKGDASLAWEIGFSAYFSRPVGKTQIFQCLLTIVARKGTPLDRNDQTCLITRYSLQETRGKKVHILLAEDNKINQKLAVKILEKQGYRIDIVENGNEAIKALGKTGYDLVLMDLQMPELGGLEATRTIRSQLSQVKNHQVPIIAMTAHAMKEDKDKCLEVGMNGYVSKPIDKEKLFQEIEKQIRRSG